MPATSETTPQWRRPLGAGPAWEDFFAGFARSRIWMLLARRDIQMRYRRSMIGPFWISISMAVMVLSLAFLYGQVFKQEFRSYLSYLACGFLSWGFLNALISEACGSVIESEGFLRNVPMPLTLIACRTVFRQFVYFLHNVVVIIPLVMWLGVGLKFTALEALWGVGLYLAAGLGVCLVLGPLCARFRDLPQLVANLLQVAFFITPIFWMPENLPQRAVFVDFNPFYVFIQLIRAPILGAEISEISLIYATICIAWLWAAGIVVFLWSRRQLNFWL